MRKLVRLVAANIADGTSHEWVRDHRSEQLLRNANCAGLRRFRESRSYLDALQCGGGVLARLRNAQARSATKPNGRVHATQQPAAQPRGDDYGALRCQCSASVRLRFSDFARDCSNRCTEIHISECRGTGAKFKRDYSKRCQRRRSDLDADGWWDELCARLWRFDSGGGPCSDGAVSAPRDSARRGGRVAHHHGGVGDG
jgi:hypothetical protein